MFAKIGRNEPCPCGSGKKYKHCCFSKDNVFAFPGNAFQGNGIDDNKLEEYRAFAESRNPKDGPVPSFMEWQGKANPATDALNALKQAVESIDFNSKEEMQAFLEQHMQSLNESPHDDFLGISPEIMNSILSKKFSENASLVELNANIPDESLKDVPVLKQCRYILQELSGSPKGIKGTGLGNFPRRLLQEFYEKFVKQHAGLVFMPMREFDVPELERLRLCMLDTRLIRKERGRFFVTKKGEKLLSGGGLLELYKILFHYFSEYYNWLYGTGYPEAFVFFQNALIFNLFILKQNAAGFIPGKKIADIFKTAFPQFVKDTTPVPERVFIDSGYCHLFLDDFARHLGLVEMKHGKNAFHKEEAEYRISGLFGMAFVWKI